MNSVLCHKTTKMHWTRFQFLENLPVWLVEAPVLSKLYMVIEASTGKYWELAERPTVSDTASSFPRGSISP